MTVFAPSSAGKTTLIHILAGLDREYEGSFTLAASRPATIFQEPRLFPYMTVEENILLPLRMQRAIVTAETKAAYEQWLGRVRARPFARATIRTSSRAA